MIIMLCIIYLFHNFCFIFITFSKERSLFPTIKKSQKESHTGLLINLRINHADNNLVYESLKISFLLRDQKNCLRASKKMHLEYIFAITFHTHKTEKTITISCASKMFKK